jgi:single-stranded-DNA-specific exonuclease
MEWPENPTAKLERSFVEVIGHFDPQPIQILTHNDTDGLAAGVILMISLQRAGRETRLRIVSRGESTWSENISSELKKREVGNG